VAHRSSPSPSFPEALFEEGVHGWRRRLNEAALPLPRSNLEVTTTTTIGDDDDDDDGDGDDDDDGEDGDDDDLEERKSRRKMMGRRKMGRNGRVKMSSSSGCDRQIDKTDY
jgi:hypothetical protein